MGCVVANYAPQSIIATDLSAFTHIADEPWKLLRMDGSDVSYQGLASGPETVADILHRLRSPDSPKVRT
ncbi:MAG: hypothetical protein ACI9LO_002928 [Planctomycetota bacterium]|jgi:hypothetical protein